METIQSLLLGSVCCPSFTGVKECAQDAGSVHPHLGVHRQVVVGPHPFVELGHDCGGTTRSSGRERELMSRGYTVWALQ